MARGKKAKPVMLINNCEFFGSITEAAQKYNLHVGNLIKCCSGKLFSCGHTEKGAKMVWRYYDMETMTVIEPENLQIKNGKNDL